MDISTKGDGGIRGAPPRNSLVSKETPQLKLIERLLRAKATGIWNRHFLIIVAFMAGFGYLNYAVTTSFRDLYVLLFFYPLIHAAIIYRLKGVIVAGLVFLGILLPQALPVALAPDLLVRYIVLAAFPFLISGW